MEVRSHIPNRYTQGINNRLADSTYARFNVFILEKYVEVSLERVCDGQSHQSFTQTTAHGKTKELPPAHIKGKAHLETS